MRFFTITLALIASSFSLHAEPQVQRIATGLDKPVWLTAPEKSSDYLYILEKPGRIKLYDRRKKQIVEKPFLDITDQIKIKMNEQGLLGMAFSPNYAKDKRFYLYYTDLKGDTRVSRFTVKSPSNIVEENLLHIKQPYRNHNGGWIGFGPDGMLYIGTGDGGSANDPKGNGQGYSELGKLLRIDVSTKTKFAIPKDNPYRNTKGQPETVYATGLRNPWRCAWDGDLLYIADVGQNAWEEVNCVTSKELRGANFGWRLREATHQTPRKGVGGPKKSRFIDPIHEIKRKDALSVTGGYVYRGKIKSIQGQYFFADWITNRTWSLHYKDGKVQQHKEWTDVFKDNGKKLSRISSFGQDPQGELYIISHNGQIYKITDSQ